MQFFSDSLSTFLDFNKHSEVMRRCTFASYPVTYHVFVSLERDGSTVSGYLLRFSSSFKRKRCFDSFVLIVLKVVNLLSESLIDCKVVQRVPSFF